MRLSHYIQSYQPFPAVIPVQKASSLRVTHPSAMITSPRRKSSHRLACVKHSVSVHPEPGSNSSFNLFTPLIFFLKLFDRNCITLFLFSSFWFAFLLILLFCFYCPFVMRIYFALTKIILPHYITLCQLLFLIFFVFFNIQINTLLSHIYFFCTFIDNNS